MKKITFLCVIIFLFSALFISCISKPVVFNESLPPDQVAVVHFNGIKIVAFNNIAVDWEPRVFFGLLPLIIPGGEHEFTLHGESGWAIYNNIPFIYDFENGREYTVYVNHHIIRVYNGKSLSKKNLIDSFDMTNGQKLIN